MPDVEAPHADPTFYQARLKRLESDPVFAGRTPGQLARLLGQIQPVSFEAGKVLFERGAKAAWLFLIDEGDVELTLESGRKMPLLTPRCGEEAATDVKTYLCGARATRAVRGLRIPRDALAELAQTDAGLASRAMLGFSGHLGGEALAPAQDAAKLDKPASRKEVTGWAAVIVLPPLFYFAGSLAELPLETALFGAILSATVLMWLFSLADEYVPPLLAIAAVMMVGLVPSDIALAGFSSRALTTLIGVYALASLIAASGLSYRVMMWLLLKLPDTPFWQQTALLLSGYLLSPVMPSSNARLSLLMPFYKDMTIGLNHQPQGSGATALMAALFSGAMLFSPMLLTSKSANLTVYSMLPVQVQDEFQGSFWLVAAAVAALTVTLAHFAATRITFNVRGEAQQPLPKQRVAVQLSLLGPVTLPEKAALLGFFMFVVGAATVPWHHVNPAWLAAFILVALLFTGLVSKKDFQQKIDWPMIFFLLSLDGISRSVTYLGLDVALSQAIGDKFDFVGGSLWLFIPLALVVTLLLRLVLPLTAGMVMASVVLMPVALSQDIHPWVAVFLAAMFSDMWFSAYQMSSYTQLLNSGFRRYYNEARFMRYNFYMNLARVLAAFVSVPYWQWLGLA